MIKAEYTLFEAQQKSLWRDTKNSLPETILQDNGYKRSIDVLATNGKEQWIAYLVTYENDPDAPSGTPPTWFEKHVDSDILKNITHWQPLLPLP